MARKAGTKVISCPNPKKGKNKCVATLVVAPGQWKVCTHCGYKFQATKALIAAQK
jgi:hypothetical protein